MSDPSALRPEHLTVLRLLLERGESSRGELADATGWARNTVAQRLGELVELRWVAEVDEPRTEGAGRPTTRFRMRTEDALVFAASFGQNQLHGALVTLRGEVIATETIPVDLAHGPASSALDCRALLDRLRTEASGRVIVAVVGVASPVDEHHRFVNPVAAPGWFNQDLDAVFRPALELPLLIENDANLMALGSASGERDEALVFVKVAGGIGAGTVLGGRLLRGARGYAGEIGHTPHPGSENVPCACGNRGCVAEVAAVPAIIRHLAERGRSVDGIDGIRELVRHGDPVVVQELRFAGRALGETLVGVITAIAPHRVVLGGKITRIGEHFATGVREALYARSLPALSAHVRIEADADHEHSAVRGAAMLARDRMFPRQ